MCRRLNVVLTGFMGTGKTTVGKIISEKLNLIFLDIDELIEKTTGMKISEIFKKFGENRFRDIEAEMVKIVTKKRGRVISTGGGVVLREENLNNLRKSGIVFCLTASPKTIFERTRGCEDRPLLQGDNTLDKIKKLMNERRPFYEKAGIIINTDGLTAYEVADIIIKEYERLTNGKDQS